MFFHSFLAILTLAAIFYWSIRKPSGYPPGPPLLPIIGNLNILKHLRVLKFHHLLWHNLTKLYGCAHGVVGLKFFHKYLVIVSSRDAIREVYTRDDLNGRPDGFFFRVRTFNERLGVVFTDGVFWENQRRFAATTLKRLGVGKFSMAQHIENEAAELVREFANKSDKSFYMHNAFDISVLNLMWVLLKGERFKLNDQRLIDLVAAVHKNFQVLDMSGGILNLFPFVRHIFPVSSGYKALVDTMIPIWDFLAKEIEIIKKKFKPESDSWSFIETYHHEIQSGQKFFTDEQLFGICIDFFQAGSETTSNSLAFAMLYMLHYPKVRRNVQQELLAVVGAKRFPKLSDRPRLKYTDAVICEIQRCANIAPLGIAHRALHDTTLKGFFIPKDTIVICNLFSLNMDDKLWTSPEKFDPERFLNDEGDLIIPDFFIPFGMGKRRCIGENVAKSSLFLFFASVLHFFDIEAADELPDLSGIDGISLAPKPYRVNLKLRFSAYD